jgi:hypothetical protein
VVAFAEDDGAASVQGVVGVEQPELGLTSAVVLDGGRFTNEAGAERIREEPATRERQS